MRPGTGRESDKFMLRFPDGMRDQIKRHAEANSRSMNAEIISLLDMALWDAERARLDAGLEPFREMTDQERDHVQLARESIERRKKLVEKQFEPVDFKEITSRLERIEAGINEAIQNSVDAVLNSKTRKDLATGPKRKRALDLDD